MSTDDKLPGSFVRSTYRDIATPFEESLGFETSRSYLQTWKGMLTAALVEQHLDKDQRLRGAEDMLISVHAMTGDSSLQRALDFANTQRIRLFFDSTYQDPDVWLHVISCDDLAWVTVQLSGECQGKSIRILQPADGSCCFISTANMRKLFNIQSRWATNDEWFAVGHIPAQKITKHIQLAHGRTLPGRYGRCYKLVPIHPDHAPQDLIILPSLDITGICRDRQVARTEAEEDELWTKTLQADEGSAMQCNAAAEWIYQYAWWGSRKRIGIMTYCIDENPNLPPNYCAMVL